MTTLRSYRPKHARRSAAARKLSTMTKLMLAAAGLAVLLGGCGTPAPAADPTVTPTVTRVVTHGPSHTPSHRPTHTASHTPTDRMHTRAAIQQAADLQLELMREHRWGKAWDGLTDQSKRVIDRGTWIDLGRSCQFDYTGWRASVRGYGNDLAVIRFTYPGGHAEHLMRYQHGAWRYELGDRFTEYVQSHPDPAAACRRSSDSSSPDGSAGA